MQCIYCERPASSALVHSLDHSYWPEKHLGKDWWILIKPRNGTNAPIISEKDRIIASVCGYHKKRAEKDFD